MAGRLSLPFDTPNDREHPKSSRSAKHETLGKGHSLDRVGKKTWDPEEGRERGEELQDQTLVMDEEDLEGALEQPPSTSLRRSLSSW